MGRSILSRLKRRWIILAVVVIGIVKLAFMVAPTPPANVSGQLHD